MKVSTPNAASAYISRTFKYRLRLTPEQERLAVEFSGVVRLVYNLGLEQRRDWWRNYRAINGKVINFAGQNAELKHLRAEFDFIRDCPQVAQSQALRDLDRAFINFFSGRAGYPSHRKKFVNESFTFPARECGKPINSEIRVPKMGKVRYREHRAMPADANLRTVTVIRDALGWHICLSVRIPHEVQPNQMPAVGIDRGVARTIQLSDGEWASMPKAHLNKLERTRKVHQRAMARRKRGSVRYAKARALKGKVDAKIARVKKHWNHEQTKWIADDFGMVVLEDLKIRNMVRSASRTVKDPGRNVSAKSGLNRSILNQNWYQFEILLTYKLTANGGEIVKVPPQNTSRTCSCCGSVSQDHRKNQAVFECSDCRFSANADENAAINILRAGTRPAWIEGATT